MCRHHPCQDRRVDVPREIRARLRAAGDPQRASGQQAYMKSAMPFHGVTVPATRSIARRAGRQLGRQEIQAAAASLWDGATHREERYAAMALLGLPAARGDWSAVPLIEHMVRTGQWWDITDELAHRVADLHDSCPAETSALVLDWCVDPDPWVRRTAILSQLGRRERTSPTVLAATIEPNAADPEFFQRKAIGWALREYAKVAPDWVRSFVETHDLSPLSRREALRHLAA